MSVASSATIAGGIFAAIGACGLFASALAEEAVRRRFVFKIGNLGFMVTGLVSVLASAFGALGGKELFGGLLLVIFGTGTSLAPHEIIEQDTR